MLFVMTACNPGGNATPDAAVDVPIDAPVPMIGDVLTCGVEAAVGGMAPGTDLQRYDLDTAAFPDALCNDGTAAVIYVRPYQNAVNQNRWVIQLLGGGSCNTAQECANRWCRVDTAFSKTQMSSHAAPASGTIESGIFLRAAGSAFGNWNQVLVRYCSSDVHAGTSRDVVVDALDPVSHAPVRFRMHFLGDAILQAALATLRADGVPALSYTIAGGAVAVPDLDQAEAVVFAGASAGGAGLIRQVDRLRDQLRATNPAVVVTALVDSVFGPDLANLDLSLSTRCTMLHEGCDYAGLLAADAAVQPAHLVTDDSCTTWHAANAPATAGQCADVEHVIRHHVTTPMFVRQGQTDSLISALYVGQYALPGHAVMTIDDFADRIRVEMQALTSLSTTAEEGAAILTAPGGFSPHCAKHETLRDTGHTFLTTITEGATIYRMEAVIANWSTNVAPSMVITPLGGTESCAP